MKVSYAILAIAGILSVSREAPAADLTKIDRTIVKEPIYRSKSPRYCLLVFGASAKTRMWLVLDDEVLHVDSNGRGKLAEDAKRIAPTAFKEVVQSVRQKNPPVERDYLIGDVIETDSKMKHTDLRVSHYRHDALKTVLYCVYVKVSKARTFRRGRVWA